MLCWWKEMDSMQCQTNCLSACSITRRLNQETSGYYFEYEIVGKPEEPKTTDHKIATCFGACGVGCIHYQQGNKVYFTTAKAVLYA